MPSSSTLQSISLAAGDAPHVSIKKQIAGVDAICD